MKTQFHLKNHLLLSALAAAYPVVGYTASAASVDFVAGNVIAINAAGVQRALNKGSTLDSGELIKTGDGARAQLRFSDGALMSLQPQTEFRIDNYRFEGKQDGQEKGFFSLIKGGLRTITGLVGRSNKENYKVSTSVATIGIRGTEYSLLFTGGTDGKLSLATGEGSVEVCNAGGCAIITGGQAAVVTGANTQPRRTETKPVLSPAASTAVTTTKTEAATYSTSENRTANGGLSATGGGLTSGPGYAVITSGLYAGSPQMQSSGSTSATFSDGATLQAFETNANGGTPHAVGVSKAAFAFNGVLGWGSWSSGTATYMSADPLSNFHYVVGKPTSSTDLTNMGNATATYALIGYTTPTAQNGAAGSNVTGSLTLGFQGGGVYNVSAQLAFNIGSSAINVGANVGGNSGHLSSFNGTCNSGCTGTNSVTMQLLLAGANAVNAGMVYKINPDDASLGYITGAAAFGQTGISGGGMAP